MTTLSPRYSDDSIGLWRATVAAGWRTRRLQRSADAEDV